MEDTWKDYFNKTFGRPPRPLLVEALTHLNARDKALDLGAGALNDSAYLLEQNFNHVTAVDKVLVATEVAESFPKNQFEYIESTFESFSFPTNSFNLINAQFALPFILPEEFTRVFIAMKDSLKEGGVLTGQFFGDRDEWKTRPGMTFKTRIEAEELLQDFKVISFKEEEMDAKTAMGSMKHWHIFHFIVQKLF